MRLGILTDIHGDYETMQRVLDRLEREQVDRLICLGDLVVHGPEHNKVVDFFRERPEIPVVKGNHDIGASIGDDQLDKLHYFSESGRVHTEDCRAALTPENSDFLRNLPLEVEQDGALFTHATIGNPFTLLRHPSAVAKTFDLMRHDVMFAGHTHRSRVHHWPQDKPIWCTDHPAETKNWVHELKPGDRYIINVGATAQLKYDFFPPICAVYEPNNRLVRFVELPDLRR